MGWLRPLARMPWVPLRTVGPRAVEKLFQDFLGLSPTTYLRHQRLHGVRRELLAVDPAPGAVKHAALGWGFIHQGRFAGDYLALFGESPHKTLGRCGKL